MNKISGGNMFILGILFNSLSQFLQIFFKLIYILLVVRVFLSWVNSSPYSQIVVFVYRTTEPILSTIRRFVPNIGMLDISPIVAFVGLGFLENVLVRILRELSIRCQ